MAVISAYKNSKIDGIWSSIKYFFIFRRQFAHFPHFTGEKVWNGAPTQSTFLTDRWNNISIKIFDNRDRVTQRKTLRSFNKKLTKLP